LIDATAGRTAFHLALSNPRTVDIAKLLMKHKPPPRNEIDMVDVEIVLSFLMQWNEKLLPFVKEMLQHRIIHIPGCNANANIPEDKVCNKFTKLLF